MTSPQAIVGFTFADLDYLGLAVAFFLDPVTGRGFEKVAVRPLGWRRALPDSAFRGDVAIDTQGLRLAMHDETHTVALQAHTRRLHAELIVTRPPGHESLNVVVPWSDDEFQLNSKQFALPARGTIVADGRTHALTPGDAFACLDFGRGVWPRRTSWNWASAAGRARDGATVGLNFGARWTDGTGQTENGVLLDGRLHKLGDVLFQYDRRDFRAPWTLAGDGVALRFVPSHEQTVRGGPLVSLHLCFGRYSGRVLGREINDLLGWAEEFRARW